MALPGKEVRLGRIFSGQGKTLIVPIDHSLGSGPIQGLKSPSDIIEILLAEGVNAILTTYGVASRFAPLLSKTGLIIRMDGGPTDHAEDPEATGIMCTVEDALRIGADAIITSIWLGGPHEIRTATQAMKLSGECDVWGMPLIIETFISSNIEKTVTNVALISRIAAELGADVVKTYLRGDEEKYREVTATCFRPIVILGGDKSNDQLEVLNWAKIAINAGAAGTCIGRNIFQHNNPRGVIKALKAIIHSGASVDEVSHLI